MKIIIASWYITKIYILNKIGYNFAIGYLSKISAKEHKMSSHPQLIKHFQSALSLTLLPINCVEESMASFAYYSAFGIKCAWRMGSHKENRSFHAWNEIQNATEVDQSYYILDEITNYL